MTIQHGCLRNGIFSGGKQRLLACACSGRLLILVVSLSELILLSVLMIISTPKHTTHKLLMYMNEVMACMDNLSNACCGAKQVRDKRGLHLGSRTCYREPREVSLSPGWVHYLKLALPCLE